MAKCLRCKKRDISKNHHKYCKKCHREIYGDSNSKTRLLATLIHTKLKEQKMY